MDILNIRPKKRNIISFSIDNVSFYTYYFLRLIFALAEFLITECAIMETIIPSENAPTAVVAAAATIPPSNENIHNFPFLLFF